MFFGPVIVAGHLRCLSIYTARLSSLLQSRNSTAIKCPRRLQGSDTVSAVSVGPDRRVEVISSLIRESTDLPSLAQSVTVHLSALEHDQDESIAAVCERLQDYLRVKAPDGLPPQQLAIAAAVAHALESTARSGRPPSIRSLQAAMNMLVAGAGTFANTFLPPDLQCRAVATSPSLFQQVGVNNKITEATSGGRSATLLHRLVCAVVACMKIDSVPPIVFLRLMRALAVVEKQVGEAVMPANWPAAGAIAGAAAAARAAAQRPSVEKTRRRRVRRFNAALSDLRELHESLGAAGMMPRPRPTSKSKKLKDESPPSLHPVSVHQQQQRPLGRLRLAERQSSSLEAAILLLLETGYGGVVGALRTLSIDDWTTSDASHGLIFAPGEQLRRLVRGRGRVWVHCVHTLPCHIAGVCLLADAILRLPVSTVSLVHRYALSYAVFLLAESLEFIRAHEGNSEELVPDVSTAVYSVIKLATALLRTSASARDLSVPAPIALLACRGVLGCINLLLQAWASPDGLRDTSPQKAFDTESFDALTHLLEQLRVVLPRGKQSLLAPATALVAFRCAEFARRITTITFKLPTSITSSLRRNLLLLCKGLVACSEPSLWWCGLRPPIQLSSPARDLDSDSTAVLVEDVAHAYEWCCFVAATHAAVLNCSFPLLLDRALALLVAASSSHLAAKQWLQIVHSGISVAARDLARGFDVAPKAADIEWYDKFLGAMSTSADTSLLCWAVVWGSAPQSSLSLVATNAPTSGLDPRAAILTFVASLPTLPNSQRQSLLEDLCRILDVVVARAVGIVCQLRTQALHTLPVAAAALLRTFFFSISELLPVVFSTQSMRLLPVLHQASLHIVLEEVKFIVETLRCLQDSVVHTLFALPVVESVLMSIPPTSVLDCRAACSAAGLMLSWVLPGRTAMIYQGRLPERARRLVLQCGRTYHRARYQLVHRSGILVGTISTICPLSGAAGHPIVCVLSRSRCVQLTTASLCLFLRAKGFPAIVASLTKRRRRDSRHRCV